MARRKYHWRVPTATREEILQTARKEKLSGAQVAKRFGISAHTYYSWRSPARGIHVKSKREAMEMKKYAEARRQRILETATKRKLTGDQVAERFGISKETFYRWRGPVYRRRGKMGRPRGKVGRPRANGHVAGRGEIEAAIRARVQEVLPGIIREQVDSYLAEMLGARRRGRPRTGV